MSRTTEAFKDAVKEIASDIANNPFVKVAAAAAADFQETTAGKIWRGTEAFEGMPENPNNPLQHIPMPRGAGASATQSKSRASKQKNKTTRPLSQAELKRRAEIKRTNAVYAEKMKEKMTALNESIKKAETELKNLPKAKRSANQNGNQYESFTPEEQRTTQNISNAFHNVGSIAYDIGTTIEAFGGDPKVAARFQKFGAGMSRVAAGVAIFAANPIVGAFAILAGAATCFKSLFGADKPDPMAEMFNQLLGEIRGFRKEVMDELHQLRSELQHIGQVLQEEIRAVGRMVAQVLENQKITYNAVQRTFECILRVERKLDEHSKISESALKSIAEYKLTEASFNIKQFTTGKRIDLNEADIHTLALWLTSELKKPTFNGSVYAGMGLDRTLPLLVNHLDPQEPVTMPGFLAAQLRHLFGSIIPEEFSELPAYEMHNEVVNLFLSSVKNSEIVSPDSQEEICRVIQKNYQSYADFISFLKNNPHVWESLFNLYDTYRDKVGLRINNDGKCDASEQEKLNESLNQMEEKRLLLCALIKFVGSDCLPDTAKRIEKLESIKQIKETQEFKMAPAIRTAPTNFPMETAFDRLRYNTRIGNRAGMDRKHLWDWEFNTNEAYHKVPRCKGNGRQQTTIGFWQQTTDMLYLNLTQEKDSNGNMLYTPFSRSELIQLINVQGDSRLRAQHFCNPTGTHYLRVCNYSMQFLCASYGEKINAGVGPFDEPESNILHENRKKPTAHYYQLCREGKLKEAENFLFEKNNPAKLRTNRSEYVNPYCLLMLVSIAGGWKIFEDFIKQYPLKDDYNFTIGHFNDSRFVNKEGTVEYLKEDFYFTKPLGNSGRTAIEIAAEHGRADVVEGILKLGVLPSVDILRNAAKLALEQGHFAIARKLNENKLFTYIVNGKAALCTVNLLTPEEVAHLDLNLPPVVQPAIPVASQSAVESTREKEIKELKENVKKDQEEFKKLLPKEKPRATPINPQQDTAAVDKAAEQESEVSESESESKENTMPDNDGYETAEGEDDLLNEEIIACGLINAQIIKTGGHGMRSIPVSNFPTKLEQARFFKLLEREKPGKLCSQKGVDGKEVAITVKLRTI